MKNVQNSGVRHCRSFAPDEVQFDEIFEEFVEKRNAMGYQEVLKQKTVLMNAAKEKMGISE